MPRSSRDPSSTFVTALRARRRRPAFLALLAAVLLAQAALVVHRIDHNAASHSTLCAACVAADQSADTGHTLVFASVPQAPTPILSSLGLSAGTPALLSYRSRAPPEPSLA